MDNQLLLSIEEEESNLELHVKLCEQRYKQLTGKLDHVDSRLDRLETHIVDIKDAFVGINKNTSATYLKWAGVVIGLLASTVVGLLIHFAH